MGRRALGGALAIAALALLVGLLVFEAGQVLQPARLPLADAAIIREEAAAKHLDPALVAAVIYAETKFDARPSSAGAQGLMQILPSTAYFLAHLSGGVSFTAADLATPRINVAYGTYYLRYLLDHYDGDEMLAVAAYNGGLSNVDEWVARAQAAGRRLTVAEIPFPQTRAYVQRVLAAQREYRRLYGRQLGLR
jgi:soluble lytic murein transglycosylase